MNKLERRSAARARCMAAEGERRASNLLWIRNVRVSAGELASWQLGPDLTRSQTLAMSPRGTVKH